MRFQYDGSRATPLGDLEPGTASSAPRDFNAVGGGQVVFAARMRAGGDESYMTNGTAAGTVRIDIVPGTVSSSPGWFQPAPRGGLLFVAWRRPVLGQTMQLRGTDARSGIPGVVLIGFASPQPLTLPRSPGCHLSLDSARPNFVVGAVRGPAWRLGLPIPNDPGLNGGSVVAQTVLLTWAPAWLTTSNAVRLVLGR